MVEEARLESVYTPKGYHEFESRSLRFFCLLLKKCFKAVALIFQSSRFFYSGHLFQFLDNLLYIYRLQPSVHFLANHHYRSQSAGAYAAQAVQ